MDPNQTNARQQIIDRLKEASNVLVTVNSNPSVDQLAACIGLTLLLNKLGKHGTAVFSGEVPSTLEFLQPEKTLEHNTDSLRDFIIALDKSKADKLRYKVEEATVKIFITPYRTSLSSDDLEFSHGDFNVDAVVALGVHEQGELDAAITAQGRILHDATIISINNMSESSLGTINWHDEGASSLCEMLADMGGALKENFLDGQMATAFLTGIVAETERFSNDKTTPQTMTVAGKLMTAGANQQLIATKLEEPESEAKVPADPPPPANDSNEPPQDDDSVEPSDDTSPPDGDDDGTLQIAHENPPPPSDDNAAPDDSYGQDEEEPEPISEIHIDEHGNVRPADEQQAQAVLDEAAKAAEPIGHPHIEVERHVLPDPAKPAGEPAKPLGEDSFLPSSGKDEALDLPPVAPSNVPLLHRDSSPAAPPAGEPPAPPAKQTISEIEAKTNSPHASLEPANAPPSDSFAPPNLDAARGAVDEIARATPDQKPLDPIMALNALPVDLDLGHDQSPTLADPPAPASPPAQDQGTTDWQPPTGTPPAAMPPPVPPPMMPPPPPTNPSDSLPSSSNPFTLPPAA